MEIISRVDRRSEWVNSIVVVEEIKVDIRICLDPHDLNKAIMRENIQLPTVEEIMSQMAGAKFVSKVDARAGYGKVKVDEQSSKLLVINTLFGRFKFDHPPFGNSCASEA